MKKALQIKENIYWVGSLDPDLRVFDIVMETEFGTTYNSYLVKGSSKNLLVETVKLKYFDDFFEKLKSVIEPKDIDYILVNHTEPDHAGSIEKILDFANNCKIVGSKNAIDFLKEISNRNFEYIIVNDGDTLDLGNKTLKFISAPFLHWPDSIWTYLIEEKVLFTCDAFGSHYSFDGVLYSKIKENQILDYRKALHYYYQAIFSPFKSYVLQAIQKIKDLQIDIIGTGHGPVLDGDIKNVIETYRKWSLETNPDTKKKVIMVYVSAYGYTESLANKIEEGILSSGDIIVRKFNINISNYSSLKEKILSELYFADGIIFGSSTINGDILPPIWDILINLSPISHSNKIASAFGSYGWSGEAVPNIVTRLKQLRMRVVKPIKVRFKPDQEDLENALAFGKRFGEFVLNNRVPEIFNYDETKGDNNMIELPSDGEVRKWRCTVCGVIVEGVTPPDSCPACGVGKEMFEIYEEEVATSNNSANKYLVIGSGAASVSACDAIRKNDKTGKIIIYTKENDYPYYRPMLSDYIFRKLEDKEFYIKDKDWFKQNNVEIVFGKIVKNIDDKKKMVIFSDNSTDNFDKLIIATGSRANSIPIDGSDKNGVFTIRGKEDIDNIKEYIEKNRCKDITFLGGGVLALEAASGFMKLGKNIAVIEREARIFPRQLDEEGSKILEKHLEDLKVKFFKSNGIKKITGDTSVKGLELDSGEYINCDILIICAGIKINKEIVEGTSILTKNGILVNDRMETNVKDIYACGDVAEFNGIIQGLWATAVSQGKVAGINACGGNETYKQTLQPVVFDGFDINIFSVGDIGRDQTKKYQIFSFIDNDKKIYKKIYFIDNICVGGILIGDVSKSSVLLQGVNNKVDYESLLKRM